MSKMEQILRAACLLGILFVILPVYLYVMIQLCVTAYMKARRKVLGSNAKGDNNGKTGS